MPAPLMIAITNDLAEIEPLSQVINEFIARQQLPAKLAFELNLALDELLTNTISYGYEPGQTGQTIYVRGVLADGFIILEIEDGARAFNPLAMSEPDLDAALNERPIGGLGIYLVRQLMDDVTYQRRAGKNLLTLKKAIPEYRTKET